MSWKYSGGASNSDPNASLGGAKSSVSVDTGLNGLFDDVSGAESEAGDVEYRCVYWVNSAGKTVEDARAYIYADASGSDSLAIGVDAAGKNGTATTVANEDTAPSGVTFSSPSDYANGIQLGNFDDGDYIAIWVKRTVPASASAGTSSWTIRVRGQSAS